MPCWEVGKYGMQTLLKAYPHHFTMEILLSGVKLSHNHSLLWKIKGIQDTHCRIEDIAWILTVLWICLSNKPTSWRKEEKIIWLLLSQTAERKENQNKTKTKWIINSPLPILWSLTLQIWQKSCTQKTLALQTSSEVHVNHIGVEPLWLHLGLLKHWGKGIHLLSMIQAYILNSSGKLGCGCLGMARVTHCIVWSSLFSEILL